MNGAPSLLTLPTDRPRPSRQSFRGALVPIAIEPALLLALRALSRRERVSLFMTFAAALSALLSRLSGQEDVSIGVPVAGRMTREAESAIGLFVNTIVLRTDVSGSPTYRELLSRVREGALSDYERQALPLERLVLELSPERSLARSPLFQVMLAMQNVSGSGLALPGLEAEPFRAETGAARFDLTFFLNETPGGFEGALEYATDLFDAKTAERMARQLVTVLSRMAADPDERVVRRPS